MISDQLFPHSLSLQPRSWPPSWHLGRKMNYWPPAGFKTLRFIWGGQGRGRGWGGAHLWTISALIKKSGEIIEKSWDPPMSIRRASPSSPHSFSSFPHPSSHSSISQTCQFFVECQAPSPPLGVERCTEALAPWSLHSSELCVSSRGKWLCLGHSQNRVGT